MIQFHVDDQPTDRNYKNDIYIVLYDTIEEQVITVTMKILQDVIFFISKKKIDFLQVKQIELLLCDLNFETVT